MVLEGHVLGHGLLILVQHVLVTAWPTRPPLRASVPMLGARAFMRKRENVTTAGARTDDRRTQAQSPIPTQGTGGESRKLAVNGIAFNLA